MNLILPKGTDVSRLVPEFTTCSPNEKVYIGNVEQLSGTSSVDFTQNVKYRLVSTLADHPDMQAISDVTVKIIFQ